MTQESSAACKGKSFGYNLVIILQRHLDYMRAFRLEIINSTELVPELPPMIELIQEM